ncbi:MAG: GPW/gp25 family protein [Gammaproteobacteria bacterium]|nr:GPW/gp25 family protein [Gammaproteobacteria bacterium]
MSADESFLGSGWGFPPTFNKTTRSVDMLTGEDDIPSSLEILLSTQVGERVMQPKYGCNLDRLIFEPVDTTLQAYIKDLIKTAILYFEPRIILNDVVLIPRPMEGRIDIEIFYTVATTNTRNNYVYPFYIEEGSEVG